MRTWQLRSALALAGAVTLGNFGCDSAPNAGDDQARTSASGGTGGSAAAAGATDATGGAGTGGTSGSGTGGSGTGVAGAGGADAAGGAGTSGTSGSTTGGSGTGVAGTGNAGTGGASGGAASGASGGAASGAGGSAASGAGGSGAGMGATGAGSGSGATAGAGTTDGPFTLAWQDDFDTLDTSRWALQTFSWDGNLAQFSTANATTANGVLSIALTPEASDTTKPYRGVELRSVPTITYGKVEARIRFAKGGGVVSGLVLIYTPWPADDWNEIDIEHLGKDSGSAQLNCQVYTGAPTTPPVTTSVTPTQDPLIAPLGFDSEADFHVYAMEWTPTDVRFTADGALLRSWSSEIARMKLPQNILFTIWASSAADWAGAITPDSAPTTADMDWIKVYTYNG